MLKRFLIIMLSAILLMIGIAGLVELLLRVAHYGHGTHYLYFPKDADGKCATDRSIYLSFAKMDHMYYLDEPFLSVQPKKPAGVKRILILGASAAYGVPDPAFSFSRQLQAMFQLYAPEAKVEIYSAAYPGINSRILRKVLDDCMVLEPDVVIYYEAINELMSSLFFNKTMDYPKLVDLLDWLNNTRSSQLALDIEGKLKLQSTLVKPAQMRQIVKGYEDSSRQLLEATAGIFQHDLNTMVNECASKGITFVLCTYPNNRAIPETWYYPDMLPNQAFSDNYLKLIRTAYHLEKGANYPGAIELYKAASILYPGASSPMKRIALCYRAMGNAADEKTWDAKSDAVANIYSRSLDYFNPIIRNFVASAHSQYLQLVDVKGFVESQSSQNVPGEDFFFDSVHYTPDGNFKVAQYFFGAIGPLVGVPDASQRPMKHAECDYALGLSHANKRRLLDNIRDEQVMLTSSDGPFISDSRLNMVAMEYALENFKENDAIATSTICQNALQSRPDDFYIWRNLVTALADEGKCDEALAEADKMADHFSNLSPALKFQGETMMRCGKQQDAIAAFQRAVRASPNQMDMNLRLSLIGAATGAGQKELALKVAMDSIRILERPSTGRPLSDWADPTHYFKDAIKQLENRQN